ncbi:MAG: radical SAM family heme chaperone HemW [Pseudomonadales bacterium]|nr:radical SAM family heme chaperone HemW [Pseudomonadales bacterium]
MNDIPLSLYVHIPWCVRKCPYCDFNSHAADADGELPEAAYVERLIADLAAEREHAGNRPIESIFIGGGTPSLFSASAIEALMAGIDKTVRIAPGAEITMEANPGTLKEGASRLAAFAEAGINRLSIGVQSFNPAHLAVLGRIHSPLEARRAFEFARQAGFENINLDLMHGLPEQDIDAALADLDIAIELGPEHISWYQLTIEPNTEFYRRPPVLPAEDMLSDIYAAGSTRLSEAGYAQYEVSAYSTTGRQSRHNLGYWLFGDYIGIGAGAHGKLTQGDSIVRTRKTRLPRDYLGGGRTLVSPIGQEELPLEFLMNALRLPGGFPPELFSDRTGLPFSRLDSFLERATARGLLSVSPERIMPTPLGTRFLDSMLLLVDDA